MISRCLCIALLVGVPLVDSCGPDPCAPDDGQPLLLCYSKMKIHPTQDAAGNFVMPPFPGPVVTVQARIRSVWLENQSCSIASETSVTWMELLPGEVIPGDPTRKTVELRFDQYALWVPFKAGRLATLTFSEKGEFVFVAW